MAAAAWTFRTAPSMLLAALEIDRRLGLKERVSSAVAMRPTDRQTEAGRALLADADARLRGTAVAEKFPSRPPRCLFLAAAARAVAGGHRGLSSSPQGN